jgi:hypothetical protein
LCENIQEVGANAPLIFLFGVFTVPCSAIAALLYNFISDKTNSGEPSPADREIVSWQSLPGAFVRNIVSLAILLSITLSSIFVVYTWLSERERVHAENYSRLQFECTLAAEKQTNGTICSKKTFDMSYCLKVVVAAPDGQKVYFVNRAAFVDCVGGEQ